jgi:hypothetical protein
MACKSNTRKVIIWFICINVNQTHLSKATYITRSDLKIFILKEIAFSLMLSFVRY